MNTRLFPFIIVLVLIAAPLFPAERVPVPLDHWCYPLLEYFTTKHVLSLDLQTKPVTREAISLALDAIREKYVNGALKLDTLEDDLLASLFEEFYEVPVRDFRNSPRVLHDAPSFSLKEATALSGLYASDERDIASLNTLLWGRLGRHLAFCEHIRIIRAEHPLLRDTVGTRPWKDFRGTTPIALLTLPFSHFTLNVGRMTPWLGPGRFGTLLLSNHYPFYDGISAEFSYKKLTFTTFFLIVSVDSSKYLSGHRLELFDIWGTTVGLSEFVIYANRIEPGYLNPLLIIYGEQFNRGDRDNVFWTLDVSRSVFGNNTIYGEFLIDDFQYESTPPAPNKIGLLAGLHLVRPFSIPRLELLFEYARITKWTYSHKYSENTYSNNMLCLGHDLGPDADRIDVTVREFLRWNIVPQAHFSFERHGEGRIFVPWEPGVDPHPPFPSGTVMTKRELDLSVFIKLFPSSEINAGWRTFRIENKYNIQDWIEQDNAFFIDLVLTF